MNDEIDLACEINDLRKAMEAAERLPEVAISGPVTQFTGEKQWLTCRSGRKLFWVACVMPLSRQGKWMAVDESDRIVGQVTESEGCFVASIPYEISIEFLSWEAAVRCVNEAFGIPPEPTSPAAEGIHRAMAQG